MNTRSCRTCLSIEIDYDIADLPNSIHENKTYFEIMLFCLGIAVSHQLIKVIISTLFVTVAP